MGFVEPPPGNLEEHLNVALGIARFVGMLQNTPTFLKELSQTSSIPHVFKDLSRAPEHHTAPAGLEQHTLFFQT